MTVRRIFVEKRQGFDIPAQQLCDDLKETFHLDGLEAVRIINRYDIEGLSDEEYEKVKFVVFAEAPVDKVYEETLPAFKDSRMFAVEYLPGQYDQTADSAAQCVQLVTQKERPQIATARVIVLTGTVDDKALQEIKDYCINAVESREASLEKPESLDMVTEEPADVEVLTSFNAMSEDELHAFMDARADDHGAARHRHVLVGSLPPHDVHDGYRRYHDRGRLLLSGTDGSLPQVQGRQRHALRRGYRPRGHADGHRRHRRQGAA